ncbi:MAG: fimbrillin family protein [Alistipes sp.]|nr:fimbrillin family protein [Alistipes sp.]
MKKILLSLAAVAMLAACSKEDTLVQQAPEAIGFDNAFVENSTRSVNDPSFDADNMFSDFAVYGFVEGATLFDGTRVAKADLATDQTKTGWEYEGTVYWIAGAKYNFNAVAPLTDGGWTKTAATKDATTLSFTNNGTTDLLYAYAAEEGKVSGNPLVAFTFRHTLSKVKFSFENAYNASNATIKVRDVKITDAYAAGNVVLTDATAWSTQSGKLELAFGNAVAEDAPSTDAIEFGLNTTLESYNELFMIPGAGPTEVDGKKTYTVTFIVDLLVSHSVVKSYPHTINAVFAPEAGKSYDLKATINAENIDPQHKQEPIEFTVNTLPDWGTTNNQDI